MKARRRSSGFSSIGVMTAFQGARTFSSAPKICQCALGRMSA